MSLEARRERAAGRIAEDERLRGRLDDETFLPLQGWALAWVDAYARASAGLDDAEAETGLEAGLAWARAQLSALVGLIEGWEGAAPAARLAGLARLAPTFPAPTLASRAERLARLTEPAEAARRIAAALPRAPG